MMQKICSFGSSSSEKEHQCVECRQKTPNFLHCDKCNTKFECKCLVCLESFRSPYESMDKCKVHSRHYERECTVCEAQYWTDMGEEKCLACRKISNAIFNDSLPAAQCRQGFRVVIKFKEDDESEDYAVFIGIKNKDIDRLTGRVLNGPMKALYERQECTIDEIYVVKDERVIDFKE